MKHRVVFILAVAVLALAMGVYLLALQGAGSEAQATTPTPTASPTPTQHPQSTITIRFVRDGQQITIARTTPFRTIHADGSLCDIPVTDNVVVADQFTITWPLGSAGLAEPCVKGPPTTVRFEFRPYDLAGEVFAPISRDVLWNGDNVVADLEIPPNVPEVGAETPSPSVAISATPSATPVPTETPAGLPASGAVDAGRSHHPSANSVGLLLVGFGTILAGLSLFKGGRSNA